MHGIPSSNTQDTYKLLKSNTKLCQFKFIKSILASWYALFYFHSSGYSIFLEQFQGPNYLITICSDSNRYHLTYLCIQITYPNSYFLFHQFHQVHYPIYYYLSLLFCSFICESKIFYNIFFNLCWVGKNSWQTNINNANICLIANMFGQVSKFKDVHTNMK